MLSESMDTPQKIENSAWKFFEKVIGGLNSRPKQFPTDSAMAKAAGVGTTTFCEYKLGRKGHEEPGFITTYKLAYILKGSPPCAIGDQSDLFWINFQEAQKKDNYGILSKILAILIAGGDLEPLAASIDVYYKRIIISPQKARESA